MIRVCNCHPTTASFENHNWSIEGEFVDVLSFLCEMCLNRQHGTEMLIHSQSMYSSLGGVTFHFTSNWSPNEMNAALNEHTLLNIAIRSSIRYLGTDTYPTNASLDIVMH